MEVYVVVLHVEGEENFTTVWATKAAAQRYAERACRQAIDIGQPYSDVTITAKPVQTLS